MDQCRVITDASVSFVDPTTRDNNLLQVIPIDFEFQEKIYTLPCEPCLFDIPRFADQNHHFSPSQISATTIQNVFGDACKQSNGVVGLFSSNRMFPTYKNALQAAAGSPHRDQISVLDSLSISSGLGALVQKALYWAGKGKKVWEIEEIIREWIPRVYNIIATNSPSYLYYSGLIDLPQALTLEANCLTPVFMLEDGCLSPIQKVKSPESLFSFLTEFIDEYSAIDSISLECRLDSFASEIQSMEDHCRETNPDAKFKRIDQNPYTLFTFGLDSLILTIVEE